MNKIKKNTLLLFFAFATLGSIFMTPQTASAQVRCDYEGQCVNNQVCECTIPSGCSRLLGEFTPTGGACGSAIIGGVEPPEAIKKINSASGGEIGIVFFISRIINIASIIAGIIVLFNFVTAGFTYITSAGNSSAQATIRDKLTWSIVGIIIIVVAYTAAGLIGLIFFDDPSFILNPRIEGAL